MFLSILYQRMYFEWLQQFWIMYLLVVGEVNICLLMLLLPKQL